MSDKVRELAVRTVWIDGTPAERCNEFERILRSTLEPLLKAAQTFLDARPFSIRHSDEGGQLAAELQHWTKP